MKSRSQKLLDRAVAAMIAAIEVYNKPDFRYRSESFCILAINAWELLLKAKWLKENNNRLTSLYVIKKKGKRPSYKKTASGLYYTHNLRYLVDKLAKKKMLNSAARENLLALLEFRNTSTHFYHRSLKFEASILRLGIACLKNFILAVQEWFNEDLSRYNFYLMPVQLIPSDVSVKVVSLSEAEKKFFDFLTHIAQGQEKNTGQYSFAVNAEVNLSATTKPGEVSFRITDDPEAPELRLSQNEIPPGFLTYNELVERCRERYEDFKVDARFHEIKRSFWENPSLVIIRYYNPRNPRSGDTKYYSPKVLNELDKYYSPKNN